MKVLAVLMIATGLLAGCASPRRAVNMLRRRPLRKFCPRCKRLIPPGMVPRANSVCMPDDWSVCGGIVESTAQKLWRILWGTEPTPRWVWFLFGFGLAGLLLAGCAPATYEQQLRCAKVGSVPNMFNGDLCVQATPSYGPGHGTAIQNSTDYATGGANRGANCGFCYGCQGGYAPPSPRPPVTCQTMPITPGRPERSTMTSRGGILNIQLQ
jgi:hypothetical protein